MGTRRGGGCAAVHDGPAGVDGALDAGTQHGLHRYGRPSLKPRHGPCSLDGYPALEFADSDGDAIPVGLAHGLLESGENAAPARVVIGPGEQAAASVQWRTNQVDGYSRLPSMMAVEAVAGTGFSEPADLFHTPNIIDGSEVRLSPWKPVATPRFRPPSP